jgi:uncharacterized membrane protein
MTGVGMTRVGMRSRFRRLLLLGGFRVADPRRLLVFGLARLVLLLVVVVFLLEVMAGRMLLVLPLFICLCFCLLSVPS